MSPAQRQLVEELYDSAVMLEPARRAAFLAETCSGDEAVRREVESLLACDDQARDFLEAPAVEMVASSVARGEHPARLLHYDVLEKLGEGGMGVVYKARDTHLDRFVALKVLPAEKVADPDRKRRFIQEAKAASALNHPHIVTVHDVASGNGADFIAMEYVAGKTLGQLIGRKGLPLNEALKYAIQIADALAAAHAAGIVHRDLKPGNIMVNEKGAVKVLDFGLAKLTERVVEEVGSAQAAPLETEKGTIVGTVAYMSPEQAEGKKVDARSDIFSFGAVLYEMVTGQRAFRRDSQASTLAAILKEEPKPIEGASPEVEKLVGRCLRKDPERRIQHMGDVKLALEELKEESESGKLRVPAPPRPSVLRWAIPVFVLLGAAIAGVTWWLSRSPTPASAPALTRLTWDSGLTTDPALSPDGKLLAYASDRSGEGNLDIYVRQVGGGEPIRLTRDPADESEPAFSPDGTTIAFRSEREGGGIYVVPALGGQARRIAPEGRRPQFSPDGNWIAYWVGNLDWRSLISGKTYVVAPAGGVPRQLRPDFDAAAYPTWSPDGTHLLFVGNRDKKLLGGHGVDWWVTPLDAGPAIRTGALEATRREKLGGTFREYTWVLVAPTWQPQGDSLLFSARSGDSTNLWRIGISPKTWKVAGPPQRLTSGPTLEEKPSVAAGPGGSVRTAFTSVSGTTNIWSLPIEANQGKVAGEPQRLTLDAARDFHPALSADGSRMVFVSDRTGSQEIWIKDLRSGEESALTASRSSKYSPHFSPDGSRVSFKAGYEKWGIFVMPTMGGAAEMVCEDCGQTTDWSSDGKRIVGNSANGRVWLLDLASRRKTELVAQPGAWNCCPQFSPDNRWITFSSKYVAPFRGEAPLPESSWIATIEGMGLWSPDGTLLYGDSDRDGHRCIWTQRLDPATKRPIGAPFAIFHSHSSRRSLSLGAVGRDRIVFEIGERTGNIWMAEWKER